MEIDQQAKLYVYRTVAERGMPPRPEDAAAALGLSRDELKAAYAAVAARRLLVLEPDGLTIRMAPPFSGVATQHRVEVAGTSYFANCAWDALGIPAAFGQPGEVFSRCEASFEPLHLRIGRQGPGPTPWLFHCPVPAARWWQDIVYT
jgi:hypothetical protein